MLKWISKEEIWRRIPNGGGENYMTMKEKQDFKKIGMVNLGSHYQLKDFKIITLSSIKIDI